MQTRGVCPLSSLFFWLLLLIARAGKRIGIAQTTVERLYDNFLFGHTESCFLRAPTHLTLSMGIRCLIQYGGQRVNSAMLQTRGRCPLRVVNRLSTKPGISAVTRCQNLGMERDDMPLALHQPE